MAYLMAALALSAGRAARDSIVKLARGSESGDRGGNEYEDSQEAPIDDRRQLLGSKGMKSSPASLDAKLRTSVPEVLLGG